MSGQIVSWTPVDKLPEEYKDGRRLIGWGTVYGSESGYEHVRRSGMIIVVWAWNAWQAIDDCHRSRTEVAYIMDVLGPDEK